jgi:3-hydroxyacyl-CoA dehydrogenase/3-hydroxy-2-methylbutyryl-CoA dehydrogenase
MKWHITLGLAMSVYTSWATDRLRSMNIADSVYFISGGASGLGEAAARRLAANGAAGVVISDLNLEAAQKLASELGEVALAVRVDVQNTDEIAAGMDAAISRFGRIDAAINCAGIGWAERTLDRENNAASIDNYRRVININLVGTFDVTRIAASHIAKNEPQDSGERGVIVMTASLAAFDGQIGQAAYSASKGGIVGMTLPLSRDLAATGIRVVTVAPGLIDTPIYDTMPEGLKERLASTPVFPKRLGLPDEYAHLVQAILENGYLNGETIRLDAALRMAPK